LNFFIEQANQQPHTTLLSSSVLCFHWSKQQGAASTPSNSLSCWFTRGKMQIKSAVTIAPLILSIEQPTAVISCLEHMLQPRQGKGKEDLGAPVMSTTSRSCHMPTPVRSCTRRSRQQPHQAAPSPPGATTPTTPLTLTSTTARHVVPGCRNDTLEPCAATKPQATVATFPLHRVLGLRAAILQVLRRRPASP
jgi:hypothetical protein